MAKKQILGFRIGFMFHKPHTFPWLVNPQAGRSGKPQFIQFYQTLHSYLPQGKEENRIS